MRIEGPGHPTCAPPAERQEITEVPALGCHSCAQRSAAEPRGNPGRWYSGCTAVADQWRQTRDPPTDHRERTRPPGLGHLLLTARPRGRHPPLRWYRRPCPLRPPEPLRRLPLPLRSYLSLKETREG